MGILCNSSIKSQVIGQSVYLAFSVIDNRFYNVKAHWARCAGIERNILTVSKKSWTVTICLRIIRGLDLRMRKMVFV